MIKSACLTRMLFLGCILSLLAVNACRHPAVMPPADNVTRIAFGSCMKQDQPQPIWQTILAAEPDMFLFIGDNIYGDTTDMDVMRAKYNILGNNPDFQAFRQKVPIMATWDDHDYGQNDAGENYPMKEESKQVFLEFFEEPAGSERWNHPGVYTSRIIGKPGKRVQLILLDTRTFRSSPLPKRGRLKGGVGPGPYTAIDDTSTTLLGETQWQWLEEQLQKKAEVRIIASSIQVLAEGHGWEGWLHFPHEQDRLFELIESTRASGVLFISGDRHLCELSVYKAGPYPLYDLTSSGMNNQARWSLYTTNPYRTGKGSRENSFGLIDIIWHKHDTVIRLSAINKQGRPIISRTIKLSNLRPR